MESCKILLIDDDSDDAEMLSNALNKTGVDCVDCVYSVMQAFSYLDAIKNESELPNLIVTDLYLPIINGSKFLQDLKETERYRHIPVIVLSTIKPDTDMDKYKAMGAADFLIKPSSYKDYSRLAEIMKMKAGV